MIGKSRTTKHKQEGAGLFKKYKKKPTQQCFIVSIVPKIFEKKIREYPTLKPIDVNTTQIQRYKERESPVMHIEQVSKNISEHGRLQRLVETFTGQVDRWWDTHQSRLQTWTIASTCFIERFGGKKLTNQAQIYIFTQGHNLEYHIRTCEKEWKRLGYKMNIHVHTYFHRCYPTYQTNGTKWKKLEVKHSYGMNSKKILSKISTLYHNMRIWLKQQNILKNLYSQKKPNP